MITTVAIIGCLLGSLALGVGMLYCMLEQELENRMKEEEGVITKED